MNRLTRKTNGKDYCIHCRHIEQTNELFGRSEKPVNQDEYYKEEPYQVVEGYYNEDILVKLGKLEDLEEKLGCPLEVVFKALKDGITFLKKSYQFDTSNRITLHYSDYFKCYCFLITYEWGHFNLKDYQKTWWLKGEKDNDTKI